MGLPSGFKYLRNMTIYPKKGMRKAYIDDYGEDLEKKYDTAEKTLYKQRIFCLDCADFKACQGTCWLACPYKAMVLKITKEE